MEFSTSPAPTRPDGGVAAKSTGKIKVAFRGVPETLLIPLQGRRIDAESSHPILGDPYSAPVLAQLDYDLTRVTMSALQSASVSLRTRHFDRWTEGFLAAHRGQAEGGGGATVLHLACGLDSRARRVDWAGPGVRWVDVDLPEVVALRREVGLTEAAFSDGGSRDYRLVAASVTDEAWLADIPNDRPTIVVMEGLVSYLTEEQGKSLLRRLVQRFPRGGELLFEAISEWLISRQSKLKALHDTEAKLQWAAGDPKSLESLDPRLRMEEAIGLSESPGLVDFTLLGRLAMYLMSWIPQARDSSRFVRYKFTEEPA